jgi:hypothetical protein
VTGDPSPDVVFAALRDAYSFRLQDGSLVDVRRAGDEAVLVFRWEPLPDLFGVPVPLRDTGRRLDWDRPAAGLRDWLESVDLWVMEDVENGFVSRAARRRVGDYIELREPGWPADDRFYVDVVAPGDRDAWLRTDFVANGSPYVAQATVVREDARTAHLDLLEVVQDAPATLVLDVVRAAAHLAAERGAATVWTDLELDHLELAGFRPAPRGRMVVDTAFLDEDPTAAADLLRAELARPSRWGEDRDRDGRYLPRTRLGRLLHRARHGKTGAPPRLYVG